MNDYAIRRYRWAVVGLCVVLFIVALLGIATDKAATRKAYVAGTANGFVRGACFVAGELDAQVAAEMADDCAAAEARHEKRLGAVW